MRETIERLRSPRRRRAVTIVNAQDPAGGLRAHAVMRLHETLDEVPGVLRRLKTFLLIGSITMIAFAAGMIAVLWHAVR
jgi:hypothetical protein